MRRRFFSSPLTLYHWFMMENKCLIEQTDRRLRWPVKLIVYGENDLNQSKVSVFSLTLKTRAGVRWDRQSSPRTKLLGPSIFVQSMTIELDIRTDRRSVHHHSSDRQSNRFELNLSSYLLSFSSSSSSGKTIKMDSHTLRHPVKFAWTFSTRRWSIIIIINSKCLLLLLISVQLFFLYFHVLTL